MLRHPVHVLVYNLVYVEDLSVSGKILAGVQVLHNSVSELFDVRNMGGIKDFVDMRDMPGRAAKALTLSNPGSFLAFL